MGHNGDDKYHNENHNYHNEQHKYTVFIVY